MHRLEGRTPAISARSNRRPFIRCEPDTWRREAPRAGGYPIRHLQRLSGNRSGGNAELVILLGYRMTSSGPARILVETVWTGAVCLLGGDREAAAAAAADLVARHAESHHRSHDNVHVRDAAVLSAELRLPAEERAVLIIAADAHDVVYDRHRARQRDADGDPLP